VVTIVECNDSTNTVTELLRKTAEYTLTEIMHAIFSCADNDGHQAGMNLCYFFHNIQRPKAQTLSIRMYAKNIAVYFQYYKPFYVQHHGIRKVR
jgi:hypothetical protein